MFAFLFPKPLAVGSLAPDFTLSDPDGNPVTLSRLRGRNVVLVFYPGDDTPGCTKQLCEFRDRWAEAQAKNTLVFGVNPQAAGTHARFRAKYSLTFPLLVDQGRKVCALYHAKGIWVRRTVYLIGKDGAIRFARRGMPKPEEVLDAAE